MELICPFRDDQHRAVNPALLCLKTLQQVILTPLVAQTDGITARLLKRDANVKAQWFTRAIPPRNTFDSNPIFIELFVGALPRRPPLPFACSPLLHAEHVHHVGQHETFWQVCPTGSQPYSLLLFAQVVCLRLTARQCCRQPLPQRLHLPLPLPLRLPSNLKQDQEQQTAKVLASGWLLKGSRGPHHPQILLLAPP